MTTEEPPSEVTAYQIHLPSFEGPLALLLHLIEKRQLEITTISLVAVTDQFIEYLREQPDQPIARLADFVALASRLLVIKSRSLLPRTNRPEDEAETAEALADAEAIRRNLLEYKLAKEIAALLRERSEAGLQSFARTTPPQGVEEALAWVPPRLTGLSVRTLRRLSARDRRAAGPRTRGTAPPHRHRRGKDRRDRGAAGSAARHHVE